MKFGNSDGSSPLVGGLRNVASRPRLGSVAESKGPGQRYFILYRDEEGREQTRRLRNEGEARTFLEKLLAQSTSEDSIELRLQVEKVAFSVSYKPIVEIFD